MGAHNRENIALINKYGRPGVVVTNLESFANGDEDAPSNIRAYSGRKRFIDIVTLLSGYSARRFVEMSMFTLAPPN